VALPPDEWVALGEIARAHGVRGEVRVRLYNPDSDLLLEADEVLVRLKDGETHEVSVDRARRADDAILMKLYSVDDRDRADELRGATLSMKRGAFPAPLEGEFYHCDLIGAPVRLEAGDGAEPWGHVGGFRSYPAAETIVVRTARGELEVPLHDHFVVSIDGDAGLVVVKNVELLEDTPS